MRDNFIPRVPDSFIKLKLLNNPVKAVGYLPILAALLILENDAMFPWLGCHPTHKHLLYGLANIGDSAVPGFGVFNMDMPVAHVDIGPFKVEYFPHPHSTV